MRRIDANAPNAEHLTSMLRWAIESTGRTVAMCRAIGTPEAEDVASECASQAVRAAKLLGLYHEEKSR